MFMVLYPYDSSIISKLIFCINSIHIPKIIYNYIQKGEMPIFTRKEYSLIKTGYFNLLRETESYLEFQSKNTKHCWIIYKHSFDSSKQHPIFIYHKHTIKTEYYHKHWECYTVAQAVKSIKGHDEYVLNYNYH